MERGSLLTLVQSSVWPSIVVDWIFFFFNSTGVWLTLARQVLLWLVPLLQPFFVIFFFFFERVSWNYLPRLVSNLDPPDLCLLGSKVIAWATGTWHWPNSWRERLVSFLLLWRNIWENQLKGRKVYFGSRPLGPTALGLWQLGTSWWQCVVEKNYSFHDSWEAKRNRRRPGS
jgi:hypothetical protein